MQNLVKSEGLHTVQEPPKGMKLPKGGGQRGR
ncbi:hypothetical protein STENM223S_10338 [Streptomyces tendae]